jgi:hypothetical protein
MKKFFVLIAMCALVLAFSPAVFADMSPARQVVIPEGIWAAATGGGTWITSLQIVAKNIGTNVYIQFFYQNTNSFRSVSMFTSSVDEQAVRYSNVLASMGTIDDTFDYYGRVGVLLIFGQDDSHPVYAQAMTTNGNYGKTFPSLSWNPALNSADVGREHVIPGMQNTSAWRTSTGFWNSTSSTMDVTFYVMVSGYVYNGTPITRTFQAWGFMSFNPFLQAGISGTSYTNCYLLIWPTAKAGSGQGLYCYGSLANNFTNDTMSLISQPWQ